MESMISRPTPGQAKTTSMITEPAISRPMRDAQDRDHRQHARGAAACRPITVRSLQALGAGRADEVGVHDVDHPRARQPHDRGQSPACPARSRAGSASCQPALFAAGRAPGRARTAKKKIIIRPSQKPGTAWPIDGQRSAPASRRRRRGFRAARPRPAGPPVTIAKASAAMPSLNVFHRAGPDRVDRARLPPAHPGAARSRPAMRSARKLPYCTMDRVVAGRERSMHALDVLGPSLIGRRRGTDSGIAHQPGDEEDETSTTMKTTTIACSRRIGDEIPELHQRSVRTARRTAATPPRLGHPRPSTRSARRCICYALRVPAILARGQSRRATRTAGPRAEPPQVRAADSGCGRLARSGLAPLDGYVGAAPR